MKRWADWELRYLRAHWPAMSDAEIDELYRILKEGRKGNG